MIVYGIHPVSEAIEAASVSTVWVSDRRDARLRRLVARARRGRAKVEQVGPADLDRLAGVQAHQGVVARVSPPSEHSIAALVAAATGPPLIVVLDGVEDPHNFGAVMRTAEGAGVDGIVYQRRRAAPPSAAAVRASAGAMTHLRLAPVVNVSRAVRELAVAGVWTVGLDADAATPYHDLDLTQATALVLGGEGMGLRRLVRERCDLLTSIPMRGRVATLNVSAAAAVVLYEAVRQRARNSAGV